MTGTALITGANGFVGRYVARAAAQAGYDVVGLGHGSWTGDEQRAWGVQRWHELDVTTSNLVSYGGEPDILFHCAGSGSVGFSVEYPAEDFHRTVITTLNVLEFVRTSSPETRIVYPSTAAVYGRTDRLPIPVDAPLNPISPYGVHKFHAEGLCRSYASNFNVSAAIVRIFSAYGPELRKQLLWDACEKVRHGQSTFAGSGHETRDWIHVEDVARLLTKAADFASTAVPTVNGATGQDTSTREILSLLFEALDVKDIPVFTGQTRPGDPDRYAGDPSLANEWGWQPNIDWNAGVEEYARWFREQYPW